MTTLCHAPCRFLGSPQSHSGIHGLRLRSVLNSWWQLPESAIRRGQSGPKRPVRGAVLPHVCAPARRPPEANLAELVGCPHPPGCRVLGLLIRRAGQLPESAIRRGQSGPNAKTTAGAIKSFAALWDFVCLLYLDTVVDICFTLTEHSNLTQRQWPERRRAWGIRSPPAYPKAIFIDNRRSAAGLLVVI